jgi:uncharacterized protein YktA (UPF0223 family)
MRLVFMVEEPSMKEVLEVLLPKILPDGMEKPLIIEHRGKGDLEESVPRKLKAWQKSDDKFIIVRDQDSQDDCKKLKEKLLVLCKDSPNEYMVRIVCRELEAWYFGDLAAVSQAYQKDLVKLSLRRKYREPDRIENAKEEIRKLLPTHQQVSGAKLIAQHMNVNQNTSPSFNAFINGVKKMANCC